jgi:hypothetical protein
MAKSAVTRRAALRTIGAGSGALTLLPFLSDEGLLAFAEVQQSAKSPAPRVMARDQYEATERLVEAILPADERSPGAQEARVADYLDLLLSEVEPAVREEWLDGLRGLDREATERFGRKFAQITPEQVDTLLTDISRFETAPSSSPPPAPAPGGTAAKPAFVENRMGGVSLAANLPRRSPLEAFFAITKDATLHGYYTSEIGLQKELRYKGNSILPEFVGCETVDGRDCPHCGQKATV